MTNPILSPIRENVLRFYIDGVWCSPESQRRHDIVDPATETVLASIALGSDVDIDKAVCAARAAFAQFSQTTVEDRLALLERIALVYDDQIDDMAALMTAELGAPRDMSKAFQAGVVGLHIQDFVSALKQQEFCARIAPGYEIHKEAIGVCGLITPWNWPISQIALKVLPALAAGCTMVLKPSEFTPLNAILFAQILDKAGVPKGVFNLVQGDGPVTGGALSRHPGVSLMSFTGSTNAGIAVSQAAATSIKRVALELGGKSPNVIFADADIEQAISASLQDCFLNSGQSCDAPTRVLVERSAYDAAIAVAVRVAKSQGVGQPCQSGDHIGPLVSRIQFDRAQEYIRIGIAEGARLVAGGPGRPTGIDKGYFVRPTVFADVQNSMRIAQEEIFGPVVVLVPFDDEADAVRIANDSPYGLAAYVQSGDPAKAHRVARQIRAGMVRVKGAAIPDGAPFGGYKFSGIGREGGTYGLEEFLETKTLATPRG